MYTFTTKKYVLQVRPRAPGIGTVTLDSDEIDKKLEWHIFVTNVKIEAHLAGEREKQKRIRENQVRIFATFCRSVPGGAREHPLQMRWGHKGAIYVLFSGKYGYGARAYTEKRDGQQVIVYRDVFPCMLDGEKNMHGAERLVARWLRDFVTEFGVDMIFHASFFHTRQNSHIDDVCRKHRLLLANVSFSKSRDQPCLWEFYMHVDGATVVIRSDCVEVTRHAEMLTPWSKMVLARPDARTILVDIARELNV